MNKKAKDFEQAFKAAWILKKTISHIDEPINGDLKLTCSVCYPSEQQDLDCELIPDLLERYGVIINDRQIREKHYTRHESDKHYPKVSIWLEGFEYER